MPEPPLRRLQPRPELRAAPAVVIYPLLDVDLFVLLHGRARVPASRSAGAAVGEVLDHIALRRHQAQRRRRVEEMDRQKG